MTRVNLGKDTSGRPLILDDTTLAKVRAAEAQLGWKFALIQGSYRAGPGALDRSGGTHNDGGAVDLRTWDIPKSIGVDRCVLELRKAGLIAWYRYQAAFPDHELHCIDYGNPNLSQAARAQVVSYLAGRNGLKDGGPDDGPRVTIPKNPPQEDDMPLSAADKKWITAAIDKGVAEYVGDVVNVDPKDPDYNKANPKIWLASAVERLYKGRAK